MRTGIDKVKNMSNEKINIRTLNVRGCKSELQREKVINDCFTNDLQVLGITETHVQESSLEEYSKNGKKYLL